MNSLSNHNDRKSALREQTNTKGGGKRERSGLRKEGWNEVNLVGRRLKCQGL